MHEVDILRQLLFKQLFSSSFCIPTVNVLPGPDWPWRCYLFNRPRHFLSHVRLFLQVQVISRVLCTKLGKVKSDPVLIFAQKLDLSLRNLRKKIKN